MSVLPFSDIRMNAMRASLMGGGPHLTQRDQNLEKRNAFIIYHVRHPEIF